MAGFNSKKKVNAKNKGFTKEESDSLKPKMKRKSNANKSQPNKKNFNVNENETITLKKSVREDVSIKALEKDRENVKITHYIPIVTDSNENLFIHIINHSKVKNFEPFILGKLDSNISDLIDKCIKDSKEEIKLNDVVDLTDGDRLMTLKR